jgi:hypothetical protein
VGWDNSHSIFYIMVRTNGKPTTAGILIPKSTHLCLDSYSALNHIYFLSSWASSVPRYVSPEKTARPCYYFVLKGQSGRPRWVEVTFGPRSRSCVLEEPWTLEKGRHGSCCLRYCIGPLLKDKVMVGHGVYFLPNHLLWLEWISRLCLRDLGVTQKSR